MTVHLRMHMRVRMTVFILSSVSFSLSEERLQVIDVRYESNLINRRETHGTWLHVLPSWLAMTRHKEVKIPRQLVRSWLAPWRPVQLSGLANARWLLNRPCGYWLYRWLHIVCPSDLALPPRREHCLLKTRAAWWVGSVVPFWFSIWFSERSVSYLVSMSL